MSSRTKNFAQHEIKALIALVHKHKKVINCRKTDRISNEGKEIAWRQIEKEFNSKVQCRDYRDMNILRTKFRNLKNFYKKRVTEARKLIASASEGTTFQGSLEQPPVVLPPDSEMTDGISTKDEALEFVAVKLEPLQDENICDDTGEFVAEERDAFALPSESCDANNLKLEENNPIHAATPDEAQLGSSWDKLASAKTEWAALKIKTEIEIMKAEHIQRLKIMELEEKKKKLELELLEMQLKSYNVKRLLKPYQ